MDPLKLLSRSTRKRHDPKSARDTQLSNDGPAKTISDTSPTTSNKRKRGHDAPADRTAIGDPVNFFGDEEDGQEGVKNTPGSIKQSEGGDAVHIHGTTDDRARPPSERVVLPHEERRRVLKAHKLKITWLNPPRSGVKERRKAQNGDNGARKTRYDIVPEPLLSFDELEPRHSVGRQLSANILDRGYSTPTEVQIAALPLLLSSDQSFLPIGSTAEQRDNVDHGAGIDLLSIAPTGSGKTLAFMIPLLECLRRLRRDGMTAERHTSAVILAPTKELAAQIVNEGRKLAKNTAIRVTQMRKGMSFGSDYRAGREDHIDEGNNDGDKATTVKADVVVSTPGLMYSALRDVEGLHHLAHVRCLVLDEADVLLDPLFKEQTLHIWHSLRNPHLRVSMWSATMGSNVEELARSTILDRSRQLQRNTGTAIPEAPLLRLIVGLKDSAAPNVEHKLLYAATEQGKLMGLRQLLHPTSSSQDAGPTISPPFLVFTQTIERAIALHPELRYDIPAEAGGISRIAVLHADLSTTARDEVMTKFREGSIWVLITTDLLSRGVDFRGVNGVVNYDIPNSSAAYIHRIGRTGRAGREGGVAVTLYSKEDMPYLKHIANVMAMAQRQRGEEATDMQKWLVDALPKLSKNEKQTLKKHGVQSRNAKGKDKNAKGARRTKISSKAGFVKREENRRKGAKAASQRVQDLQSDSDDGNNSTFAGFD